MTQRDAEFFCFSFPFTGKDTGALSDTLRDNKISYLPFSKGWHNNRME
jgi:hypothetical protein